MINRKRCLQFLILAGLVVAVFPLALMAYIDPGTGSYILQLVIAAFVGVTFTIKVFWKRIKRLLTGKKSEKAEHVQGTSDEK